MINEAGEFYEDDADKGELAEMNERAADTLAKLDGLKDVEIPTLEMKCLQCGGRKKMDYLIIRPAPWYARMLGAYGRAAWSRSKGGTETQKDVPCKRCGGTGLEKIGAQ